MRTGDDPSLLILCYHAVSPTWPSVGAVTPGSLSRQLRHVLGRGYVPATLSAALREARGRKTVVVTFDDAFRSVHERGLAVLDELGIPATVFVPTEPVSEGAPMTWSELGRWTGTEHEPELSCMSWDEIRQLVSAGWEIGSHSCSHPKLTALGADEALSELRTSREACEEHLQRPCPSLAYPFGLHNERVVALAREAGYEHAVTLGERLLEPLRGDSALELPRDGIYRSTPDWQLRCIASPSIRRVRSSRLYLRGASAGSPRGGRRGHFLDLSQ